MCLLRGNISYKGSLIVKHAASTGFLYTIKHPLAPKHAFTSQREFKAEVNRLLKECEEGGA